MNDAVERDCIPFLAVPLYRGDKLGLRKCFLLHRGSRYLSHFLERCIANKMSNSCPESVWVAFFFSLRWSPTEMKHAGLSMCSLIAMIFPLFWMRMIVRAGVGMLSYSIFCVVPLFSWERRKAGGFDLNKGGSF